MSQIQRPPTVSVIVIFLNAERYLEEAIDSVFAQTFEDWDLHLVDDGSTDGSGAIARRYRDLQPGRVHYHEHAGQANRGMSASRNLGVRRSQGELIALLDADDVWLPNKLQEQVDIMAMYPGLGLVCGSPLYWYSWTGRAEDAGSDRVVPPGAPLDQPIEPPRPIHMLYPLGSGVSPCPSEFLLRRSVVEHVGGWENQFRGIYGLYEDQAILIKVYLVAHVYFSSRTWILYRRHPEAITVVSRHDGTYDIVRKAYLEWLLSYLDSAGIENRAVRDAARRALLKYQRPFLFNLLERKGWLVRKALRRMVPAPVRAAARRFLGRAADSSRS